MKAKNTLVSIISTVAVASTLVACSGDSPARATAEAVIPAVVKASASNSEQVEMFKSSGAYERVIECTESSLEDAGWTEDQHDFFMDETNQTGNLKQIDQRKYSQMEQMQHFGPLLMAASTCMKQLEQ